MNNRERDLSEATTELSETLEALRSELREPARGPLGLPRPPRPTELFRFTEQYTIPTFIAFLETNIKALELLAAALRVADGRPLEAVTERPGRGSGGDPLATVGRFGRDQLARTSRETLQRLDDALKELQSAAEGEPSNPELQQLLGEARELRAEVDEQLQAAEARSRSGDTDEPEGHKGPTEIDIGSVSEEDTDGVGIDVDEELASIKDEIDEERSTDAGDGEPDGSTE